MPRTRKYVEIFGLKSNDVRVLETWSDRNAYFVCCQLSDSEMNSAETEDSICESLVASRLKPSWAKPDHQSGYRHMPDCQICTVLWIYNYI